MRYFLREENFMKKIFIVVFVILILGGTCYAQPTQLSDRELLIQLYSKVDSIDKSINGLLLDYTSTKRNVILLDKRVTTNESNFASFCKRFDDLTVRWNTLITIFFASLLGMVAWMLRRTYGNRKQDN